MSTKHQPHPPQHSQPPDNANIVNHTFDDQHQHHNDDNTNNTDTNQQQSSSSNTSINSINQQSTNYMKSNNFEDVNFQQIKSNGAPYNCPFCETISFKTWNDWKTHWYQLHNLKYFNDATQLQRQRNTNNNNKINTDSNNTNYKSFPPQPTNIPYQSNESIQSQLQNIPNTKKRNHESISNAAAVDHDFEPKTKRQKTSHSIYSNTNNKEEDEEYVISHVDDDNALSSVRCKICFVECTNNAGLSNHIRARHGMVKLQDYVSMNEDAIKAKQNKMNYNDCNALIGISPTHRSRNIKYKYKCTVCQDVDKYCAGHVGISSHLRSHVKAGDLSENQQKKLYKQIMKHPIPINASQTNNNSHIQSTDDNNNDDDKFKQEQKPNFKNEVTSDNSSNVDNNNDDDEDEKEEEQITE